MQFYLLVWFIKLFLARNAWPLSCTSLCYNNF